ncbi:uveal autoantigen with coiled-coil domains and ankyrin repeats-like [Ostrea edulis]|uniref:uveal autoantigen with coiled-coil domains and ankyrin repeats-like n=1 Tax=Ostrea edulis TaxID=37623 RepID=UPI0020962643|nr:uveal autoantigen with coiled-coil domains and ankyrin repeats-like [Ostrea edulis]
MALAVLRQKQSPKRSTKTNKAVALANAANITTNELNMRDANGRTVLFYAARYGKIQAVKNLLNAGSNPNIADVDGSTSLHEATERCHYDVMKLLISNGETQLNAKNRHGQTAVMKAVLYDDLEALKLLHKAGAALDEQDSTGKTALLISFGEGRERTTEYLIKNGCDVNKRDKLGQSALYLGIVSSSVTSSENIRKLLRAGYSLEKDRHWLDKAGVDVESLRHRNFFQRIISRIKIGGTGSGRRHSEGFAGLGGVQDAVIEPHPRFEVRSNSCNL